MTSEFESRGQHSSTFESPSGCATPTRMATALEGWVRPILVNANPDATELEIDEGLHEVLTVLMGAELNDMQNEPLRLGATGGLLEDFDPPSASLLDVEELEAGEAWDEDQYLSVLLGEGL